MPDIVGPIGLLKCAAALKQMQAGETIELKVIDPDVFSALVRIIGNYPGCAMTLEQIPEGHRIIVRKK
ncbi:MAG: hypothetical protein JJV98_20745 [Desulfosarcina sp.]|nr:hypothetical protein [Desulfobacterales bacterium]